MRTVRRSTAALLGLALLAGCTTATVTGADTGYISNPQEEVFVEVPTEWKQFSVDPYRVLTDRIDGIKRNPGWTRMADAAPEPFERHGEQPAPSHPVVSLNVVTLPTDWRRQGTNGRDQISFSLLRSLSAGEVGIDIDPLIAFNDGEPGVEIISYRDQFLDGKTWGSHIRVNLRIEADPEDATKDVWTTVDQFALVDYRQSKLYRLTVKCEASCFRKNKATLDRVVNSFRVKGVNVPPYADIDLSRTVEPNLDAAAAT